MNKIQKPITLLREDFLKEIQDLCNSFNKEGLPYFVMSDILKWLIPQVDEVARREAERDRALLKAEELKAEEKEELTEEKKVS